MGTSPTTISTKERRCITCCCLVVYEFKACESEWSRFSLFGIRQNSCRYPLAAKQFLLYMPTVVRGGAAVVHFPALQNSIRKLLQRENVPVIWKSLRGQQRWLLWVICWDQKGYDFWKLEPGQYPYQIQMHQSAACSS
jgi:hypothetical protein